MLIPELCSSSFPLKKDVEVPEYLREFAISTGYRGELSYPGCVLSWFRLHNETVNIWSHLLGFIIFFYGMFSILIYPPEHFSSTSDFAPIIIQLISYQICMLTSTLFHTFSCHSEESHKSWLRTDQIGIVFAFFGTYVSIIEHNFICHPNWMKFHLTLMSLLFMTVFLLTLASQLRESSIKYKKTKVGVFLILAAYNVVPFSHWAWLHGGLDNEVVFENFFQTLLTYSFAAVGLVFYLSRYPEKLFRSKIVDHFGASHQIWHVMIFLSMARWYVKSSHFIKTSKTCDNLPYQDLDFFNVTKSLISSSDLLKL